MGNELKIYKSSAGSGKTYTLVLEYLIKVIQNPYNYKSILAVTFTNKATDEMKSRVIRSLIQISNNDNPELQETISSHVKIPVSELPLRAHKVIELILHDYSRFSISTIDSFFSKIVRSLARELRLSLSFDLELDQNSIANEIVERLFDSIAEDEELKHWLEQYIFNKLDNDKGWSLFNDILKVSKLLFTEQYRSLFPDKGQVPDKDFIDELLRIKMVS